MLHFLNIPNKLNIGITKIATRTIFQTAQDHSCNCSGSFPSVNVYYS